MAPGGIEGVAVPMQHELLRGEPGQRRFAIDADEVHGAPPDFAGGLDAAGRPRPRVRVDARPRAGGEKLRAEADPQHRRVARDQLGEQRELGRQKRELGRTCVGDTHRSAHDDQHLVRGQVGGYGLSVLERPHLDLDITRAQQLGYSARAFGARVLKNDGAARAHAPNFAQGGGSASSEIDWPVTGCGNRMAAAWRCSSWAVTPPYVASPTMGKPAAARWARTWWGRPE